MSSNRYETPLSSRYASEEMSFIFSPQFKHTTWRRLWIALAKGQKQCGLPITDAQIRALETHAEKIDFNKAAAFEKTYRHDVMAHIHAYAEACPEAKPIIHLGATSCFVTDNTDLIQMREGLKILQAKLVLCIRQLASFAEKHAHLACLSYTHFQPAQPTTVGKRACMWIQDLMLDLTDLSARLEDIRFLGVKGATGTQASFLALFQNDADKVKKLEQSVAKEMGFANLFSISGQTYTRKQDMRLFAVLTGLAASSHKLATDLRLLAHLKEIEEPFTPTQVGSSAMPYKRNPMRCERICGLARFLISLNENPIYTAATQWLERTLDDSANRRLSIPEAFLCADALLNLLADVTSDLVVYPARIEKNLAEELPFIATENILMEAVKKGKDRQQIHEALRQHSLAAKQEGQLLQRISQDPTIGLSPHELDQLLNVNHFIGRAPAQVSDFLHTEVHPLLTHYNHLKIPLPKITV
jgi:adenylosuccinate lyase